MIIVKRTCAKCGKAYLSNEEHVCSKPRVVTSGARRVVTKAAPKKSVTTPSERVKAWRAANREHYNDYMRKRRAKLKEAKE